MSNENKYEIRVMTIDDYDEVYSLWQTIHGLESVLLTTQERESLDFLRETDYECCSGRRWKDSWSDTLRTRWQKRLPVSCMRG